MTDKIRVIIKEVDKEAEVKEIDNLADELQMIVGGLFDITTLPEGENIDIICNDNFISEGAQANFIMPEYNHVMGGNVVFAGYDPETGDTISLTDEQIKTVNEYLDHYNVKRMDLETAYYTMQINKMYNPYTIKKMKQLESVPEAEQG